MFSRNVIDAGRRSWACRQDDAAPVKKGQDVSILCTTPTVVVPIRLTVAWDWNQMGDVGLAALITERSPIPKRG